MIGLVSGGLYSFRVYARNSVGLSPLTQVSILVAQIPDTPNAPTSQFLDPYVVLSWEAPYDGATDILSYTVLIYETDGTTLSTELNYCDGSDTTIMDELTCTIPLSVLRGAPFFLQWGQSVEV